MSKHSRPPVTLLSLKGHYKVIHHITVQITRGCSAGLERNFARKFSLKRDSQKYKKKKQNEEVKKRGGRRRKSFKSRPFWVGPKMWVFLSHIGDLREQL